MRYAWITLLVFVLWIPVASAESIIHIGDNNPVDEGWKVLSGVAGEPDTTTEPSWRIITTGHGRYGPLELGEANFIGEWTLHVRAKWNDGAMAQQRVTIFDGYRGKSTAFTWDSLGAYYYVGGQGDTLIPNSFPDGGFHDYVLVMDGDNMVFAYDGLVFDTLEPARQNDIALGTYLLYFGDNNGAPGISDMQYARVSLTNEPIPEPSTLVLLVSAGIAGFFYFRRVR